MANFITGHRGWGLQWSSTFYGSQPQRGAQTKCQIPEVTENHEVEINITLSQNTLLTPITLISSRDSSTCPFSGIQESLPACNNVVSSYSCNTLCLFTLPVQTRSQYLCTIHNSLVICISPLLCFAKTSTDPKSVPRWISQNITGLLRWTFFWYSPKHYHTLLSNQKTLWF